MMMLLPLLVAGCDGGRSSPAPEADCDAPGTICTWMGVPDTSRTSGEGELRTATPANLPLDAAVAADGTAFFPELDRIRRVDPDGRVWTIAGDGFTDDGDGADCWAGCDAIAGPASHPRDAQPDPVAPDLVWTVSAFHGRVSRIDLAAGTFTWWAGTGDAVHADGPREAAGFVAPTSVAPAPDGTVYVSDPGAGTLRRILPDGTVDTLAGTPGVFGHAGDGGPAADALLGGEAEREPDGARLALDGDRLLIADTSNAVVRAIDLATGSIDRIAGTPGTAGLAGDGGPAVDALLDRPIDVAVGPGGEVYVADAGNACVRVIAPDGTIAPFAGQCGAPGFAGDGGPADQASLGTYLAVTVGPDGAVYVVDTEHQVIRRVAPAP